MKIFGLLTRAVLALILVSCATRNAATPKAAPADVRPLAMVFQVMHQIKNHVQTRDLDAIHDEDPILSSAVNELLSQTNVVPAEQAESFKADLTSLSQGVSALHDVADRGLQAEAETGLVRVESDFVKVKGYFPMSTLKAAEDLADTYTCPMHPNVRGKEGEPCPDCGMALDQMVRLMPPGDPSASPYMIKASITTDGPLTVGRPAKSILKLSKPDGWPVCLPDLMETHTKKIHLLIIDGSLTDYHHVHPVPTEKLGDYAFTFTPRKPGPYRAWADLRPTPLGLQQYAQTDIAAATKGLPLTDRTICYKTTVEGLTYQLFLDDGDTVHVAQPMHARLLVTDANGKGFTQLEPIMATFAHIVGFNEDYHTIMHIHPSGAPILDPNARGGPELHFQIYALKPGFVRLFAQVQISGESKFAPFGIQVVP